LAIVLIVAGSIRGQSPNATLNGQVLDSSGGVIVSANVDVVNTATNVKFSTKTNSEGMYLLPDLPPANYEIQVSHAGFKTIVKPDVLLHVRDAVVINFTLPLGAVSERVTVEGGAPLINTQDAAVSTVVDRQFAENLPMNGRSFQTLIQLTPGVVVTTNSAFDNGQFSVNGQRAASNYWMVDGVSANVGVSSTNQTGNGLSGSMPSFSVLGGTNSLVSVDALQEFRIQTSTYAPEFGRMPGAQISILTRSGTNQFHGTAFDYIRNDIFDANNWFNTSVTPALPKSQERQNDFGGTVGGPILRDRMFFLFSYEGLRLRLPQTKLTTVPDIAARQGAVPAVQPFLNAYSLPNGPEVFTPCTPNVNGCPASGQQPTGSAQFNASFSNPATLNAYSLRIDHKWSDRFTLFGRYNYSPSEILSRGGASEIFALSEVDSSRIRTQTATIGATWVASSLATNDLRFNYSRTSAGSSSGLDSFGGAVPLASLPFPNQFTSQNGELVFLPVSLSSGFLFPGLQGRNLQRQINIVDTVSIQKGSHGLKFGVDFRQLSPVYGNPAYVQQVLSLDIPSLAAGTVLFSQTAATRTANLHFHNLGVFAQDTWRALPRLTLTYGLRWDVDFAPSSNPSFVSVTGFNPNDLSNLAIAPAGTPPFQTPYGNVAPRLGIAYQLSQSQKWGSVVRGGLGLFFDTATQEAGNLAYQSFFPFGTLGNFQCCFIPFPLSPAAAAPPAITPPGAGGPNGLFAFDPNIQLPYSLQWNVAFEQALGSHQTIKASYIGSIGRRLIQTVRQSAPNPNFSSAQLVTNAATSDYHALQLQFQRRLSSGFQALSSYTWAHSIDSASAGSLNGASGANALLPGLVNANRGPSDFDIRSAFSLGLTYDVPAPRINAITRAIMRGWATETFVIARSAPPVTLTDQAFSEVGNNQVAVRPDLVPGIPLYLFGPQYPGGKAFNNTPNEGGPGCLGPFCPPPTDSNGIPTRQGNMPRNLLRGFGATQWDFALHRDFPFHESMHLQFRAEMFNLLNHPNFAPPASDISNRAQFGVSQGLLGQYLGGSNVGRGGFSSLYQIGGPRSIQFALKLMF